MGQVSVGDFDRRLVIQMPNPSPSQDSYGAPVETLQTVATVWGKARPLTGREFLAASQIVAGAQIEFTIHFRTGLDERAKIIHDGVTYDALHIAEVGFREGLKILAKKP